MAIRMLDMYFGNVVDGAYDMTMRDGIAIII